MLPFTSVVSYHTNPMTCGVAKFSAELAKRLGVPFVGLTDEGGAFPLWSLKAAEYPHVPFPFPAHFAVFWHDAGIKAVTDSAAMALYADPSLGSPGLWCPSLIQSRKQPIRLFSFGMASKLQPERYHRVRELLDAAGQPFHLRVSVGLHEGTSLDDAAKHFDALKDILGPENVTILGILSDDAVSEELHAADYVLAFFEKGLRANNTTVHAAIDAVASVITNHDAQTPGPLRAMTRNIETMTEWPARSLCSHYSWDNLLEAMKGECAKLRSTASR